MKIMASSPITSWQLDGEAVETVTDFIFLGFKITANGDFCHEIKKHLLFGRKAMTNLDSILKSRDITLPEKCPSSQSYGFSSSHVWMWELDNKETWVPKNWCFWTVVLETTLKSLASLGDLKVSKGLQGDPTSQFQRKWVLNIHWKYDAEAETPILWPPDVKNWLIEKDPDDGKDWRWEEKGMTEDEMVGWHHWLDGHEFDQALGVSDGQGGLACCSPSGLKEPDTTAIELTN